MRTILEIVILLNLRTRKVIYYYYYTSGHIISIVCTTVHIQCDHGEHYHIHHKFRGFWFWTLVVPQFTSHKSPAQYLCVFSVWYFFLVISMVGNFAACFGGLADMLTSYMIAESHHYTCGNHYIARFLYALRLSFYSPYTVPTLITRHRHGDTSRF